MWTRFSRRAPLWAVAAPIAYRAEAEQILRRVGFRRPHPLRGFLRRCLRRAFGGRPLVPIPAPLGRGLTRLGLVLPAPVCW
jgi:hypothetical protein